MLNLANDTCGIEVASILLVKLTALSEVVASEVSNKHNRGRDHFYSASASPNKTPNCSREGDSLYSLPKTSFGVRHPSSPSSRSLDPQSNLMDKAPHVITLQVANVEFTKRIRSPNMDR